MLCTRRSRSVAYGLLDLVTCERCGLVEHDLEAAVDIDAGGEWRHPCPNCGSVLRDTVPIEQAVRG